MLSNILQLKKYLEHTMSAISVIEQTKFFNLVVRAVIEHDGKYLMVQEGKPSCYGKWSFVGGKVDLGETLEEAMRREVTEETGLEVELKGIIAVQQAMWDDGVGQTLQIDFLATVHQLPEVFPTSKEVLAVAWKTVEEFETLKAGDELRNPGQIALFEAAQSNQILDMDRLIVRHNIHRPSAS